MDDTEAKLGEEYLQSTALTVQEPVIECETVEVEPEEKPDIWDRETVEAEVKELKKKKGFKGLGLRQKKFCELYVLNGFKQWEAYMQVNPHMKKSSCMSNASADIRDPRFRLEILNVMDKAAIKTEVTTEWLLLHCKRLAEEGNSKALEICKDWLAISSKSEQKITSVNPEEARAKVRDFLRRRSVNHSAPLV